MFDHYGRILCIECMSGMAAIRAGPFEAAFICENPECAKIVTYRLRPSVLSKRPGQSYDAAPSTNCANGGTRLYVDRFISRQWRFPLIMAVRAWKCASSSR